MVGEAESRPCGRSRPPWPASRPGRGRRRSRRAPPSSGRRSPGTRGRALLASSTALLQCTPRAAAAPPPAQALRLPVTRYVGAYALACLRPAARRPRGRETGAGRSRRSGSPGRRSPSACRRGPPASGRGRCTGPRPDARGCRPPPAAAAERTEEGRRHEPGRPHRGGLQERAPRETSPWHWHLPRAAAIADREPQSRTLARPYRPAGRAFVHDLAADDRVEHLRLEQVGGARPPRLHEVGVEDGDVGQLAGRERSLPVLLEGRPGRALGVGLDRLLDGQPLVGEPAFLGLALRGSGGSRRRRARTPGSRSSGRRWCPGCRCRRRARRRRPSACGTRTRRARRSLPMRSSIQRMSSEMWYGFTSATSFSWPKRAKSSGWTCWAWITRQRWSLPSSPSSPRTLS